MASSVVLDSIFSTLIIVVCFLNTHLKNGSNIHHVREERSFFVDSLLSLITGHLFMALLIAIVAVVFIISLLRSLFKLVLTAALIGIIFVVFFGLSPNDVLTTGKQLASNASSYVGNYN